MKMIIAKYASTCAETGLKIKKGERMIYDYSTKKCYAMGSEKAIQHTANTGDAAASTIQAQEDAFFDDFCQRNNI